MTERESEIFHIIQQNPAISQNELAAKLNLARSSVAVHIANLQKKGYLLGKGYIVNESAYVLGVGAANVDIHGRSKKSIVMHDSNPGHMNTSAGGVTRNVCENLSRLGVSVKLISAVGTDVYADQIRRECQSAGIDISNLYVADGQASSTYMSMIDADGDMFVALSDMTVLQGLIRGAQLVTCDPSLSEEAICRLLDICQGGPDVYADPVSTAYARKLAPYVGKFHTVKPNRMELEILAGQEIKDELYMDQEGRMLRRKLKPCEHMVNATGAGDAFTAAMIYATLEQLPIESVMDYAMAAGIAAIGHERTINPQMSISLLESILKEYKQ